MDKIEKPKIRKTQVHGGSYFLVLPPEYIQKTGLTKDDYLKCIISGNQLVVEKVNMEAQ